MKTGVRNQLVGRVTSIRRGDIMAQIAFAVPAEAKMSSVITADSLDEMGLEVGDEVLLLVKAVHVVPVKVD